MTPKTSARRSSWWGFDGVRGPEVWYLSAFIADAGKRYGPSVADAQFWWVSFCSCAARLFPKWANKLQKCSRKTTLFSSNVEHVYRPPGRHKQRGTTPRPLGGPLFSCQPVYSPSRLVTRQRWISLQLCDGSVVAGSSASLWLRSLWKASPDEERVCGHLALQQKYFTSFSGKISQ